MQKMPYILVFGDKEEGAEAVSVRTRGKGDQGFDALCRFPCAGCKDWSRASLRAVDCCIGSIGPVPIEVWALAFDRRYYRVAAPYCFSIQCL